MAERTCPGLPADWLNGWLAAVGATVLVPTLTLRWTDEPVPVAVLSLPGHDDPAVRIAQAWPTPADVEALPIARQLPGMRELKVNCDVETWAERAALARREPFGWTLSSLYTDLGWAHRREPRGVETGRFNPGVPKGLTMHDRLRSLVLAGSQLELNLSLNGAGTRIRNNGLGFDATRIGSLADDSDKLVDPVVEVLAFFGLALFPARGDGFAGHQRGWRGTSSRHRFRWCVWEADLDWHGIDATLDLIHGMPDERERVGVIGLWEVIAYQPRGSKEVTRGFSSRLMEHR